jgi:hypothetical protein
LIWAKVPQFPQTMSTMPDKKHIYSLKAQQM